MIEISFLLNILFVRDAGFHKAIVAILEFDSSRADLGFPSHVVIRRLFDMGF